MNFKRTTDGRKQSRIAEFLYKTTDYCAPKYERCIVLGDQDLGIEWPSDISSFLFLKMGRAAILKV